MRNILRVASNYDLPFNSGTLDNDWEILKLSSELELNDDVLPACLPSSADYLSTSSTEDECFTSGWGTLSSGVLTKTPYRLPFYEKKIKYSNKLSVNYKIRWICNRYFAMGKSASNHKQWM